jgi:hypothetical protein
MSAAEKLQEHITEKASRFIDSIPAKTAADVYALSFWTFSEDDEPGRYVVDVSYNTGKNVAKQKSEASDEAEARWNFAFWLQKPSLGICDRKDKSGGALRTAWLKEIGCQISKRDLDSDDDRVYKLDEKICDAFGQLAARASLALHNSGLIQKKFGSSIPVVIHNLEYYSKVDKETRMANPRGVATVFCKWMKTM